MEKLAPGGPPQAVVSPESEILVWKLQPELRSGITDRDVDVHALKEEELKTKEMEEMRQNVKVCTHEGKQGKCSWPGHTVSLT